MRSCNLRNPCFAAALGLAAITSCARDTRPLEVRLQSALDQSLRRCDAKGGSAAIIFPDGNLWLGVSGVSHGTVKMSPDMSFAIGSITKNMVASLALQLAEEGKLSLEDPVSRWLPPYPHVDSTITIRQMLNHTSGLFMFWDNQKIWDDLIRHRERTFTPEEVLGYLKEPYFAPGQGYHYSNTGYLLTAMIIVRATGSSLSAGMRKRFWEPLGLSSACLPPEEPYPQNVAHVWGWNFEKEGAYRDVTFLPRTSHDTITYGSAGVFMTAGDLARWTHALFHKRVIGEASLAQMQAFTARDAHGLGVDRLGRSIAGRVKAVGHGGANIGTSAYMAYLPDHDVSIAVMINHFGGACPALIVRELTHVAAFSLRPETAITSYWGVEGLLAAIWLLAGAGAVIFSIRKNRPWTLVIFGSLAIAAGWVSTRQSMPLDGVLYPEGAVILAVGLAMFLRRLVPRPG